MKRILGTPISEYLPAVGLLAVTIIYLVTAYGYSADARAVPAGVAWVMVVLLLADIVSRTRTATGTTLMRWLNPAGDPDKVERAHYPALKQISAVLWISGFTAAMVLIGILYAVALYVFSSLLLRGRHGLVVSVAAAACTTAMIWVLFALVLRLELYPGVLFESA